jgi:hypothetical protein
MMEDTGREEQHESCATEEEEEDEGAGFWTYYLRVVLGLPCCARV